MENFSLTTVNNLSMNDAKKYIDQYFIPLYNDEHAFYFNGEYELRDQTSLIRTFFNRMPRELKHYYFNEKKDLRSIIYDIHQPTLYDNYLNLCPMILHKHDISYNDIDESIRKKVDFIINHMNEVYCGNNKEVLNFLIKWLAQMVRGNRNKSILYLRGPQGAGKSCIFDDFIRHQVIGKALSRVGGSEPLTNRFNSALSGKLMVLFEELENFGTQQWMGISCKIKGLATNPILEIERKNQNIREETNYNNYIINTNNDAVQDDDGRRYFTLDISTKYTGNKKYFNKLFSYFTKEVGHAFYCYLMEIDLTKYDSMDFPMTESKLDSYAKRLDNVYRFVKDEYIVKKKGLLKISLSNLYEDYVTYSAKTLFKAKGKIEFNNTLANVNIAYYKSNDKLLFNYTYEQLLEISNKYHWVHKLDLEKVDKHQVTMESDDEEEENTVSKLKTEIINLKHQIAELKVMKSNAVEELEQDEDVIKPVVKKAMKVCAKKSIVIKPVIKKPVAKKEHNMMVSDGEEEEDEEEDKEEDENDDEDDDEDDTIRPGDALRKLSELFP